MTDDQGYGVSSTFGGVIPTPAMDRIAKAGLRYTQFHSTALCSPTRAALITGRNHHSSGFGVISEQSTGYPGYDSIITKDKATIGEILKDNGYATSWFGKNHNTPTYLYSLAGPFDQWPSGMGFEYFYGFMGGETNQWTPYLFRDHTAIFPWIGKPGYNLTTDMADEAIKYLTELNAAAPEKPFFLYYVPGGTHAPHHPTPEWIKKISDMQLFDKGWNDLREHDLRQPEEARRDPARIPSSLPGRIILPKWDTLNPDCRRSCITHQAEIFAAYAAYTDHEIGRVIQAVEDLGKLDNTLIIYISGDNGTSAEGSTVGTPFDLRRDSSHQYAGRCPVEVLRCPGLGSDNPAHVGGVVVGFRHAVQMDQAGRVILRWHPAGHGHLMARPHQGLGRHPHAVPPHHRHRADDSRSHRHPGAGDGEWHRPETDRRREHGLHVRQANAKAPSKRDTQYFEMFGNRAIYHDGWIAATPPPQPPWLMGTAKMPDVLNGYKWELYNIADDLLARTTTSRPRIPTS